MTDVESIPGEALAAWLKRARWSGLADSAVKAAAIERLAPLEGGYFLAVVRAEHDGGVARFFAGLEAAAEGEGLAPGARAADRTVSAGFLQALLRAAGGAGDAQLVGSIEPELAAALSGAPRVRTLGAEQTNVSAVIDERWIVKVYRRCTYGPNPDAEISRALTAAGFPHAPRCAGFVDLAGDPGPASVALAQEFLPGSSDGWETLMRAWPPQGQGGPPFEGPARELGAVTAALHTALAGLGGEFAPEPLNRGTLEEWCGRLRSVALSVDALLLRAGLRASVAAAIEALARRSAAIGFAGLRIRHHGDYHLGQALRCGSRWLIIDFEGEPVRPLAQRREKSSALRDVAGMLRSFSYAALSKAPAEALAADRLPAGLVEWYRDARAAFWAGYESGCGDANFLPAAAADRETLLALFELEKALYEVRYEAGHRPAWLAIPLAGLRSIARRLTE